MQSFHLDSPIATPATRPDTVDNIQALRGIAVLLVLWGHFRFPIEALDPPAYNDSLIHMQYGAMGVDLFFVISGFVICLAASKRHHHPVEFLMARMARIAPLYLVYVLLFLVAKYVAYGKHNTFNSIWNGLFYLPIFDFGDFSRPPGGIGWTLSFEMWFYVAFAILLCFWAPRRVALFLPIIFAIGAGPMTLYNGAWYFPRFIFHPFILEFASGCLVFHTQKWVSRRLAWILLTAGLLYLVVFTRGSDYLAGSPYLLSQRLDLAWTRTLLWGVPAALIAAGLVGMERNKTYLMPRALVWLGGISYSVYLSHQLSMGLIDAVGNRIGLHNLILITLIVPTVCIFNAWLCWLCIEHPLTVRAQWLAKKLSLRLKPVALSPVSHKAS